MESNKPHSPIYLFLLVLLLTAAILWAIVLLKTSTDAVKQLPAYSAQEAPIVVPDTSLEPQALPIVADTAATIEPEPAERDMRAPYEAGYEDGYIIGLDDGAAHDEFRLYDEDSSFPTQQERDTYKRGYRDGYHKGFADGEAGKHFGIG
ncbi:MAG: hypothetical protein IJ553_01720 [Alloprevotella sp.]|nr:hypothetical protein [Alloprevotella sp.]